MTSAELNLQAIQRLFPTIYRTRERALSHLLTTGAYYWDDAGNLAHNEMRSCDQEKFDRFKKQLLEGTAPSIEDMLRAHIRNHAERTIADRSWTSETIEECEASYSRIQNEQDEIPATYHIYESPYGNNGALFNIPDNVQPDSLLLCIELLNYLDNAKIDFDQWSVLTKSDQKYFRSLETEEGRRVAAEFGRDIAEILGYDTENEREMKKRAEEWEKFYSPRARAERANSDNKNARRIAAKIRQNLVSRGLINTD